MSIGQISIRKNQKVIIEALSRINNPKIKYVIVGFGELEQQLKKIAIEFNVADRVIFAGYREDAKALLHCADLFAFPSLQEGLPVSLMEAMAVGLPVVASNIRGNTDLITDGENGYLYNCDDIKGFVNGICTIYSNTDVRQQMSLNTTTIVKNLIVRWSNKWWKIYIKRWIKLIFDLFEYIFGSLKIILLKLFYVSKLQIPSLGKYGKNVQIRIFNSSKIISKKDC